MKTHNLYNIHDEKSIKENEKNSTKQFDLWAKNYDRNLFWPFFFSNNAVIRELNLHKGNTLLDVGCGTGILLKLLSEMNKNIQLHGIDVSSEMVNVTKLKLDPSIAVNHASVYKIPYKDNTFDFITCSTSFHHYKLSDVALSEMKRVLKIGGKLCILDPFKSGFVRKLICYTLNRLFKEIDINLYTRNQMYELFKNVGFSLISQKTYLYYKLITIGIKDN
jgi:ubiquinone/menaquinone biosynthesis C-methylase UbiE